MSRRFILFLLALFVLTGCLFFWTLYNGSNFTGTEAPSAAPATGSQAVAAAPQPSIALEVHPQKGGAEFIVRWANLPNGTAALEVFRSTKGKNDWSLWKTIPIDAAALNDGTFSFNIGSLAYDRYAYYVEAIGNTGTVASSTGSNAPPIYWTTAPLTPTVTTSTTQTTPPPPPPPTTPTSTAATTTTVAATTTPTSTTPTSTATSTPPAAPSGTPYYNPQVKISGYGSDPASHFWVQHIDQTIQIGWQNLPPQTTAVVISRATSTTGTWTTVLTQANPGVTRYSLQIADDTLGVPYYYEMQCYAGSTTDAFYGPVFLPAVGQ